VHGFGNGGEVLGALVAQIGFGRGDLIHAGGQLPPASTCGPWPNGCCPLLEKLLYHPFRLCIAALAEVVVADASRGIDEVMSRPVLVAEGAPDRILVVHGHRIADAQVFHGLAHVADVAFKGELWGVHTDHDQTLIGIFRPRPSHREGCAAVDAGVGPEIHQHHLASGPARPEAWS
jgi:hypothetical protein